MTTIASLSLNFDPLHVIPLLFPLLYSFLLSFSLFLSLFSFFLFFSFALPSFAAQQFTNVVVPQPRSVAWNQKYLGEQQPRRPNVYFSLLPRSLPEIKGRQETKIVSQCTSAARNMPSVFQPRDREASRIIDRLYFGTSKMIIFPAR